MRRTWTFLSMVLILAVLVAIGLFAGRFIVYLTMRIMILSIFAMGYNILLGRTGLLSFGHAAFYAAGAYGLALFYLHVNPNPLFGIIVGVAAGRFHGPCHRVFLCPAHGDLFCHADPGLRDDGLLSDMEPQGRDRRRRRSRGDHEGPVIPGICCCSFGQGKPFLFSCALLFSAECRPDLPDPLLPFRSRFGRHPGERPAH